MANVMTSDHHQCPMCGHGYFKKESSFVILKDQNDKIIEIAEKSEYKCEKCGQPAFKVRKELM